MKTILENIKIIVEILAIIAGMLVAIPLFRKKILDEKLNETLKELNEINKRNLPTVIQRRTLWTNRYKRNSKYI